MADGHCGLSYSQPLPQSLRNERATLEAVASYMNKDWPSPGGREKVGGKSLEAREGRGEGEEAKGREGEEKGAEGLIYYVPCVWKRSPI